MKITAYFHHFNSFHRLNWTRGHLWTDTGRLFVAPSPNMRTPEAASIYPGTCVFEGTNLSEGRGTDKPFQKIGAPFVSGAPLASALNALELPGIQFAPVSFTPTTSKFSGRLRRFLNPIHCPNPLWSARREIEQPVENGYKA